MFIHPALFAGAEAGAPDAQEPGGIVATVFNPAPHEKDAAFNLVATDFFKRVGEYLLKFADKLRG